MTARTARSLSALLSAASSSTFIGTVRAFSAAGRSRVIVAIASATSRRIVGSAATAGSGSERTELAIDELENTPVDRLVGILGAFGDKHCEERRELGVVGQERAGDEEVPIRQSDEDP